MVLMTGRLASGRPIFVPEPRLYIHYFRDGSSTFHSHSRMVDLAHFSWFLSGLLTTPRIWAELASVPDVRRILEAGT
jgi:hypothetical protein